MKYALSLLFFLLVYTTVVDAQVSDTSTSQPKATPKVNTGTTTNTGVLAADTAVSVFIAQAITMGEKEIALGKTAVRSGVSKMVRDYGSEMVKDHIIINTRLRFLAEKKKIRLASLASYGQKVPDSLLHAGEKFDNMYLEMMRQDHEASIGLFQRVSNAISDDQIKAFISQSLPILMRHHKMIQHKK